MFERFRKSSTRTAPREDAGAVAVQEREVERTTVMPERDAESTTVMPERDAESTAVVPERDAERDDDRLAYDDDADTRLRRRDEGAIAREREADAAARVREHDDATATRVRDEAPEQRTLAPVVGEETMLAVHDRQRIRFGGISWGSAFFGLLSAIGLAAILLGIVAAAGVAIGVSQIKDVTNGNADTIGLGGAILVLAVVAVSWFCGGYVAGRMARFDGMRQGIAVWVWTVVIGAVLAIVAVIGGSQYDVFARLNLPNVAVGNQSLTTGGAVTLAAALVVALIAAIVGGKVGNRFHRRVDRFAAREHVEAVA
jgi:hypothetical protein